MQTKIIEWSARRMRRRAPADQCDAVVEGARGEHRPHGEAGTAAQASALAPFASRPMSGPTASIAMEATSWNQPRSKGLGFSAAGALVSVDLRHAGNTTYRSVGLASSPARAARAG